MSHDIGETTKLRLDEVKNDKGDLIDPTKLVFTIKSPSGEVDERVWPEGEGIVKEKTGYFYAAVDWTEDGAWEGRWDATDPKIRERFTSYVGVETMDDPFPDDDFTAGEVWARSPSLKARYPKGAGDPDLVLVLAVTAPLVGSLTGRAIAGVEGEAVPTGKRELAMRAIAMKSEQFVGATGSAKERRRSLNRGNLASFSAGSYSESYFGPDQAARARKLDADPILAELLWELCTDDKKLEWLEMWDPENFTSGVGGVLSFEYGNRPNYGV